MTAPDRSLKPVPDAADIDRIHRVVLMKQKDQPSKALENVFDTLVGLFLGAYFLMIGFRAGHELWPAIPAAGYITSFGLALGLQAFGAMLGLFSFTTKRSLL